MNNFELVPWPWLLAGLIVVILIARIVLDSFRLKSLREELEEVTAEWLEETETAKEDCAEIQDPHSKVSDSLDMEYDIMKGLNSDRDKRRVFWTLPRDQAEVKSIIRVFIAQNGLYNTTIAEKAKVSGTYIGRLLAPEQDLRRTNTNDLMSVLNAVGLTLVVVRRNEPKWVDIKL